jgi:transposase
MYFTKVTARFQSKNEVICPYDGKDVLRFADSVKRPRKIRVDGAYPAEWLEEWVRDLKQIHKIDLESTTYKKSQGFQVIPWRWKAKRTFAWLLNDRRNYERLTANSAAMIQISMIQLLLNRLG